MPIRKNASMEKYIKDFEKSDAPQFKGKSKDKRIQMAVAAKLQSMGKKMEEGTNKYEPLFNDLYTKYEELFNKYRIHSGNELMHKFKDPKIGLYSLLKSNFDILPGHKAQLDTFMQSIQKTEEPMKQAAKDSKLKHEIVANVLGKIKEVAVTVNYDDPSKQDDILNEPTTTDAIAAAKAYQTSPNFKGTVKSDQGKILVHKESISEGMDRDYEGQMAKSQLISIVKNARDLFNSIDDNTQLKAWIQSKLTKAEDYISSVRTYLDSESLTTTTPLVHNNEPVKDDEGAALNIGDVVKAADGKIYQVVFSYSEGKPFLTPFDLKRRKPMNLRERHYFDNVSEEMNKTLKMSKVMEYTATKGGFMR